MLPTRIDQVEQGLGRLLSVLKEKENIEKLISIFLIECQEIEDASLEFAEQKNINIAVGAWLDYIGAIIGVPRMGRDDPTYRAEILLKIQINTADGTPNTITSLVRQFTDATDVRLRDFTIAASTLYTNGIINLEQPLFELVDQIKPAGVRIIIHTDRDDVAMLPSWEVDLPVVEFLEVTDPLFPLPSLNQFTLEAITNGALVGMQNTSGGTTSAVTGFTSEPVLTFLELFDGTDVDIMAVVTGLGGTYYRPDTTRSTPFWETTQPFEGTTNGNVVPITGVSGGMGVDIEVFTSNTDSPITLCWEVVDEALLLPY